MPLRPGSRTRSGIRISRRTSSCPRHPDKLVTGICASCLRERLDAVADPSEISPELRRCRSVVSTSKCQPSSSRRNQPRRKSCDAVSTPTSLCNLFDVDDLNCGSESEAKVQSKNVGKNMGLSKLPRTEIDSSKKDPDETRVSSHTLGESNADFSDSEGEFKTMKEYIDLEFQNKSEKSTDLREITGNLLGKFRSWRQSDHKLKNHKNRMCAGHKSEIVETRSCEKEPRFSLEESRASWDGYMIARSIPRLAPMFPVVENGILGGMNKFENPRLSVDGPNMHSIIEEGSSSGASGSGLSNSDNSSFMIPSSFDRSSPVRSFGKKAVDYGNVKQMIEEKGLKTWNDGLESAGAKNGTAKKSVRWRKVCDLLGFGHKSSEICDTLEGNVIDDECEKGKEGDVHARNGALKFTRSTSVVGPRNSCDIAESNYRRRSVDNAGGFGLKGIGDFKVERNVSDEHSLAELGEGIMPFYMAPLRSLKHCKSGKFKVINPRFAVENDSW